MKFLVRWQMKANKRLNAPFELKTLIMNELENKIYKCALEILPELKANIATIKTNAEYISLPFCCEGVINEIIYDTDLKKFVKIKYTKGKEKVINKSSGFCDKIEKRSFSIDLKPNSKGSLSNAHKLSNRS